MRKTSRVLPLFTALLLGLAIAAAPSSKAARDVASPAPSRDDLQLVVLEVPGCIYCKVFRRDILPGYPMTKPGSTIPMRFVDLNDIDADAFGLTSPVTIVPTVVLMKDNAEVARIPGYLGPTNFYKTIDYILEDVE